MISSLLIIAFSLVLLVYWFRYTCLALLRAGGDEDCGDVIAANRLQFAAVREELRKSPDTPLDRLHEALESDYRILTYLLEQAARLETGSLEQRILDFDYRLMRVWYQLAKRASDPHARRALAEMSGIVKYFAALMSQRLASQPYRA
ncbi:MAG: hypothetical protein IT158_22265 [Bryobacterales bacterium]|nr:hypothetical protein [Bryobacterales bacterium]